MKLTSDNETLAASKALILYIMSKVDKPIGNIPLLKLCLRIDENMNYFYFQQFLLDLLENKYVLSYSGNDNTIYELTTEGKQTLELVKDLIPGYLKFKVDNNFKEELHTIENELSITADFVPHSETEYSVKCKLVENGKVLFELETFAGSRVQAKKIIDNWKQNAQEIYPNILDLLVK